MKSAKYRTEPDPRAAILSLGIVSSLPVLAASWGAIGISGVFLVIYAFCHRIRPDELVVRASKAIWFIGFIILLNGVSRSGQVLFLAGGVAFTWEGLEQGLRISSQLVILLWGSSILLWSASPHRLIDAFGSWLRSVSDSGSLIMLMTVTMNLVPGFVLQARRIRLSILARGMDPTGIVNRIRFLSAAALPLFAGSTRAGQQLAIAMEARGYDPAQPRSSFSTLSFETKDYLLLAAAVATAIIALLFPFLPHV